MFNIIKSIFKKGGDNHVLNNLAPKNKEETNWYISNQHIIFNVNNFNEWFNNPNNNAVYANSGIFLRIDKLGLSQIEDYLYKKYGLVNGAFMFDKPYNSVLNGFYNNIIKDWKSKK